MKKEKDEKPGQQKDAHKDAAEKKQPRALCEADLVEKEQRIGELTDALQRLQAEFQNFKKRAEEDQKRFIRFAAGEVIRDLLPVLDSFEIAIRNCDNSNGNIKKGMELIYSQLHSVLAHQGLKPIEALGKKFDPYLHEVLLKAESEKEEDTIIEELQKGYTLNGNVLRHSKVKVAKPKEEKSESKCPS